MQISKIVESSIISAFIGIYLLLFSIGTQHLLNTSYILASLVVQLVKNLPAMQEIQVQFLGWEDPLEEGTATHSSILA